MVLHIFIWYTNNFSDIMCNNLDHDEIYTLDIGKYEIHNVHVDFIAMIQFKKLTATITLPLPINYPPTFIGTSSIVRKEGLFRAMISVITPQDEGWTEVIDMAEQSLNMKSTSAISLNSYYVIPKQYNIQLIGDELIPLTGLGKRVLCLSMLYIMGRFMLQPYSTLILLEASGSTISSQEDIKRVNGYLSLGKTELMKLYNARYSGLYYNRYYINASKTERGLANLIVLLENNSKLVDYYKQYLGLKQLSSSSLETLMGTSLDNMLNYCQHTHL